MFGLKCDVQSWIKTPCSLPLFDVIFLLMKPQMKLVIFAFHQWHTHLSFPAFIYCFEKTAINQHTLKFYSICTFSTSLRLLWFLVLVLEFILFCVLITFISFAFITERFFVCLFGIKKGTWRHTSACVWVWSGYGDCQFLGKMDRLKPSKTNVAFHVWW